MVVQAVKKTPAKKKKIGNNQECARVQSHNGRVSEVSCEICNHTTEAAKDCYIQRDSRALNPQLK